MSVNRHTTSSEMTVTLCDGRTVPIHSIPVRVAVKENIAEYTYNNLEQ